MASETPVTYRDLRRHSDAHQCCGKSLVRSALVRVGVRQQARPESISKRAPSSASARVGVWARATARCLAVAASPRRRTTTRTSLRFRINGLRAVRNSVAQKSSFNLAVAKCALYTAVCSEAGSFRHRNCVRPSDLLRSLTAILLRRADTCAQSHIADVAVLAYQPSFGPSRGTNHLIGSALRAGTTTVSHPARPARVLLEILRERVVLRLLRHMAVEALFHRVGGDWLRGIAASPRLEPPSAG